MSLMHRENHVTELPILRFPERWGWPLDWGGGQQWLRVEEFHEGDTLVVRAELTDIDPDKDVEITIEGDVAKIHAHREQKSESKDKESYRSEFRYGEFDREIALPVGTKPEEVKATYKDGILEVRIPCCAEVTLPASKVPISRT